MVVAAALRLSLRGSLLLVHALAAGGAPSVLARRAAGAAFAVTLVPAPAVPLMLALPMALMLALALPVALVLALAVSGMALLSRRLGGGGSGDREGESGDKELHDVSPEKMD